MPLVNRPQQIEPCLNSTLATDYRRRVGLVDTVVVNASPGEKRRFFRDTAGEFYRL